MDPSPTNKHVSPPPTKRHKSSSHATPQLPTSSPSQPSITIPSGAPAPPPSQSPPQPSEQQPTIKPNDALTIESILHSMGVDDYDPRIIHQLLELLYRYVSTILTDARVYTDHAAKSVIDADDVKLAVRTRADLSFATPPPRDILADLVDKRNSIPLPSIDEKVASIGVSLPPAVNQITSKTFLILQEKKLKESILKKRKDKDSKSIPRLPNQSNQHVIDLDSDQPQPQQQQQRMQQANTSNPQRQSQGNRQPMEIVDLDAQPQNQPQPSNPTTASHSLPPPVSSSLPSNSMTMPVSSQKQHPQSTTPTSSLPPPPPPPRPPQ